MIEIKGIHKKFEGRVILDGVSGVFKQGMTNMVIGVSSVTDIVLGFPYTVAVDENTSLCTPFSII